ncbi:MAG: hypothetical protein JXR37_07370 [Kiritimatiellae bacterium]|nr:hypothetical protein [Kiritimatiellia bacterium]
MKKLFKAGCLVFLVLLVIVLIGLHVVLRRLVTDIVRKELIPQTRELLEVEVEVGSVSVSVLTGSVSARDIKVGNPPGFREPLMLNVKRLDLRFRPHLDGGRVLPVVSATVRDAEVTVVRNETGKVNVDAVLERLRAGGAPPASGRSRAAQTPAAKPRKLTIRNAKVDSNIKYIDRSAPAEPQKLIRCQVQIADVETFGDTKQLSGRISIEATESSGQPLLDVNGKVGPVVDPERPSFRVNGKFKDVDTQVINRYSQDVKFFGGSADATFTLVCENGVFNVKRSQVNMQIRYAKKVSLATGKHFDSTIPEQMSFQIPVKGTFLSPDFTDFNLEEVLNKLLPKKTGE